MTLVDENELCVALTTASGVELYSYDLAANTATKLCDVADAQNLVALNLMSDLETESTVLCAVRNITGGLMNATSGGSTSDAPEGEDVTIGNGNVTVNLREDSTNGKLVITFDPELLTYNSTTSASALFSVNENEADEGKLVIAYAAADELSAEEILATLSFTYEGELDENGEIIDQVDTMINVVTEESNDQSNLNEKVEIEISNALSDDNTLASLSVAEGTLSPIFAPTVVDYTVEVAHDEDKLTVFATAKDEKATQAEVDEAAANLDKAIKGLAPDTGDNPETGDRFNAALAVAALLFSIAALAAMIIFRKKIFRV